MRLRLDMEPPVVDGRDLLTGFAPVGAVGVRHPLGLYPLVFEAFNVGVPAFAVGLEKPGVVLALPAAAGLDIGAVAVGGCRAALPAVQAEGQALPCAMDTADAAETGLPTDALLADVGALEEFKRTLRHGLYTRVGKL